MTVTGDRRDIGDRRSGQGRFTQLPFAMVLLVVAVAALRIFQYHWREGAALIGAALLLAAVLRAVLPTARAGLLAIRGKVVDIVTFTGLAAAVLYVALTIIGGPFGSS
ncbi:DUF3017 domain-containing protein [Amycolatopsis balhimycina DSM 5908]|uniref:DUF3017 domain-containing protein n=1 Tax=Amycolatopsis balhimycina DSM 5908 TaxID=1081091 RepID=A0A428VZH6_AMYBA|nr:DUF3017 domain-containing protein [Amycolatopsis balhimycina]RSM36224.1 DUF3017 domain-containing protein [Amycolatopsis balhimycina DSM 5908]